MNCPFCRHDDSRVVDSRPAEEGTAIRRRRECTQCGSRFSTQETSVLAIIKRSGATEPFSRDKVINGVRKACQGRPVNELKRLSALPDRPKLKLKKWAWQFLRHSESSTRLLTYVTPRCTVTSPLLMISKARSHFSALYLRNFQKRFPSHNLSEVFTHRKVVKKTF